MVSRGPDDAVIGRGIIMAIITSEGKLRGAVDTGVDGMSRGQSCCCAVTAV